MKKVKIYLVTCTQGYSMDEQGEGFSLEPWGKNASYYEGYDDGGQDYILPKGYHLAENTLRQTLIYLGDEYCPLITLYGKPAIVGDDRVTLLKRSR